MEGWGVVGGVVREGKEVRGEGGSGCRVSPGGSAAAAAATCVCQFESLDCLFIVFSVIMFTCGCKTPQTLLHSFKYSY